MFSAFEALVARANGQKPDSIAQFCIQPHADCPISSSYYFYRVNLAANVIFITIFGISLIAFLVTYGITRRATAFTFAMAAGVILEVIGYAGRIMSWQNQWLQNGFLIQIVCLTIAPAFMAGGLYLCLRRIVYAFGPENSRIQPESYTRIFIPCDLVSLLLQAAGGGLASSASHQDKSPVIGDNIMVAGLSFQVLTLGVFMALCLDFAHRTYTRHRDLGAMNALDQSPVFVSLRNSRRFKGFLFALTIATICIFWRSVYRVVELGEGWTGNLIRKQWLFVGFEGVLVGVACLLLNVFHPALCFKEGVEGLGGLGSKKKMQKLEKEREKQAGAEGGVANGSASDIEGGKVEETSI